MATREGVVSLSISIAFILSFMLFGVSNAQERSGEVLQQLEQKEVIPEKKLPQAPVIEKEERHAVELKKGGENIFVKQIKVEGATLLDEQTIRGIISPSENKELTLSEISTLAETITNEYRRRGYITAHAYIPAQEIKEETVTIRVIEGKVGDILVLGNKHYSTKFIQKHIEKVKKDPSLKEQILEKALLILNEYPSLDVKASIKAGKSPGTADIIASATDSRYISGGISYDNFGSETISKHRMGAWFNTGSLITDGDLLMLRGVTGLDRIDLNKLSYGRAEYLIPVDYNGTKLGVYYANSIYEAGEDYAILDIQGKAHVAGMYLTHPLIKLRDKSLTLKAGFDYKDIYDYMLSDLNSKDNIRSANIGITYDFFDTLKGRNIAALTYYQGIPDIFGGAGRNEQGVSRQGADGEFSKFTLDLTRVQGISDYNHLILRASGQFSGDTLFIAEQFFIGGMGMGRGFQPSLYGGDSGYLLSAELHLSPIATETKIFNQKLGDTIKFVLFADHGGVFKNNVQPGESKDDYLTSVGAGIRLYAGKHLSMRIDWAVPEIKGKLKPKDSKTYLQATMGF